jgi:hypothetical protein
VQPRSFRHAWFCGPSNNTVTVLSTTRQTKFMTTRTLVKGDPARLKFIASPWHLLIVITIAGPNAYRGAIYAVHASSGLGPSRSQMYLRTIAFECGFLAIVGLGVWLHGSSLHTIFCTALAEVFARRQFSADTCSGNSRVRRGASGQDCTWSRQCLASLLVRRCILIALECALNAGFKPAIQSI